MIHVPFWDGDPTHPFPSVTLLIDFRGNDVGDFPFHCHILEHEDGGMMNIVRVQNATSTNTAARRGPRKGRQRKTSRRVTFALTRMVGGHYRRSVATGAFCGSWAGPDSNVR
jgi:hypothetical protein